ncbi:MAG: hypothetical protein U0W24_02065 [Bacteroidales bacterium]
MKKKTEKTFIAAIFVAVLFLPELLPAQCNLPLSGWERFNKSVFDGFMHAYNPCIIEVPDTEYPFRMWFFGWIIEDCNPEYLGCDAIYHARSKDLMHWEAFCKDGSWDSTKNVRLWASVLHTPDNAPRIYDAGNTADLAWSQPGNRGNSYDSWHTGDPSVVYKDGTYYMAYSATSYDIIQPVEGYDHALIQCIMGATSVDGINWYRTEKPLLIAKEDLKNVFPPKPAPGRIGDFHRPSLLWDDENKKWKLYFDYSNKGCHTGMAENSGDFRTGTFQFIHPLDKPLIFNWDNPQVVQLNKNCYYCFGDPAGYKFELPKGKIPSHWPSRQINVAKSEDGIHWTKEYIIPPDPGIDACQVPQTIVVKRDGKSWLYLFYATQVGWRDNGVKYKRFEGKKNEYNWYYDQIRYMRQEIK